MCRRGIVVASTIENSARTQKARLVKDTIIGRKGKKKVVTALPSKQEVGKDRQEMTSI